MGTKHKITFCGDMGNACGLSIGRWEDFKSVEDSTKAPTHPSPDNPRFCPKEEVSVNIGQGEG